MTEKMTFEKSGLIKDETDLESIEFWGHDAGEFVVEEEKEVLIEKVELEPKETKTKETNSNK